MRQGRQRRGDRLGGLSPGQPGRTTDRPSGLAVLRAVTHPEVTLTVSINVARSQDEAERQARGENVISSQFDEDRVASEQAAADLLEGGAGQMEGNYAEA